MLLKRILALLLTIALLTCGIAAMASEREEIVSSEYVTIEGSYFAVDSLYGVEAIYSTSTSYFQCWEYVTRFYKTVYGLSIGYDGSEMPTTGSKTCWFEKATTPRPGDIAFASAERRGSYNHWAIVKSYDAESGTITLIEQNFKWNGQAEIKRTLTHPSSYYEIYTLCDANGAVEPIIDISQYENEQAEEAAEEASSESESVVTSLQEADESFSISGEYSDYVLPYARQAAEIGLDIETSGYQEQADVETLSSLIVNLLNASDYSFYYTRELAEGETSSLNIAYAMGLLEESDLSNPALTRAQAAVIMQRFVQYLNIPVSYDLSSLTSFSDAASLDSASADAFAQMLKMEIMSGSTVSGIACLQATSVMTYEQVLSLVMRLYNYVPEVIVSTVTADDAASASPASTQSVLPTE